MAKVIKFIPPNFDFPFPMVSGVDTEGVKELTWHAAYWVGSLVQKYHPKKVFPTITSAHRSVQRQQAAMEGLRAKYIRLYGKTAGNAKFLELYGKLLRSEASLAKYPHPDGRAVDFDWATCVPAIGPLMRMNDLYLSGIHNVIGYTCSSLIVVEDRNCLHVQIPRNVPGAEGYVSFLEVLEGRT